MKDGLRCATDRRAGSESQQTLRCGYAIPSPALLKDRTMIANDFWQWVASRRADSNARGRFIRETRKLLAERINPETRLWIASTAYRMEVRETAAAIPEGATVNKNLRRMIVEVVALACHSGDEDSVVDRSSRSFPRRSLSSVMANYIHCARLAAY